MANNPQNSKLNASLRQAARVGDKEWTRELLKSGAEVDSGDKGSALFIAAKNGRYDICEILLENNADVNGTPKYVPLCAAVEEDHPRIVDLLLDKGAEVNYKDGRGRTSLYIAARKGRRDTLEKLIDSGADPNEKNDIERCVPLHIAASNGFSEIAECLIERGADVNATDRWKETPLHHACKDDREEVVELLLEAGVDKDILNGEKRAASYLAKIRGNQKIVDMIDKFVSNNEKRSFSVRLDMSPPSNSPGKSTVEPVEVPEPRANLRTTRRSIAGRLIATPECIKPVEPSEPLRSRRSVATPKKPVVAESNKPDYFTETANIRGSQDIVEMIDKFPPKNEKRSFSVKFDLSPPSNSPGRSSVEPVEVPEPRASLRSTRRSIAQRVNATSEYKKLVELSEHIRRSNTTNKRPVVGESNEPEEVTEAANVLKRFKTSSTATPESNVRSNTVLSSSNSSMSSSDTEEVKDTNFQIAQLSFQVLEVQHDLDMLRLDKLRVTKTSESFKEMLVRARDLGDLSIGHNSENGKWALKKRELTFKLKELIDKEASLDDDIRLKETELKKLNILRSNLNVRE